ncbi:MAG: LEA type 2 family protein [Flavobacteriales bacterium]|jgi:hypothetical protein|nr:LEA type 2 family protein [Flavobacteriales bacterium]
MLRKITLFGWLVAILFSFNSCEELKSIANLATNCSYKVDNVKGYKIAGLDVGNKRSVKDFGIMDGIKLTSLLVTKELPIEMVVNVGVDNKGSASTISGLDWIALIDGKEMINGVIDQPVHIPANGHGQIPLTVKADLFKVFSGESGTKILETALTLLGVPANNGQSAQSSKLSFKLRPSYNIGGMVQQHPTYITINP